MATAAEIQATYKAIVRVDLNATTAQAVADAINNGTTTLSIYQAGLIQQSGATTQAALALSSFVTGTVPDSAKIDSLTAFAKTQNDYYTNVLKSGNAQLGAYEALGRAYAADATTTASFSARYGALSTAEFVAAAYGQVFTNAPTAGATANLIAQVTYFTNLYTAAGIPAAQASLQAKGAVLGQIIGYAATAPGATVGTPAVDATTLDNSLITALNTIANEARAGTESSVYGKALPGVTGQGVTIDLGAGGNAVSLDNTNPAFKSTVFADTIKGVISGGVTINTGAGDDLIGTATDKVTIGTGANVIDGSGGNDSLYATVGAAGLDATTVTNVEKIYIGATSAATIDTTKITGATEIWSHKTDAAIEFTGLTAASKVGVDGGAAATTFTYVAGAASASVALNAVAGTDVTVGSASGTALKAASLNVLSNSIIKLNLGANVETVTVSGNGELAITELTNTVKTFDASAATKAVALGTSVAFDAAAASTIKLGAGNDVLNVAFSNQFKDTITLGAGNDKVTVTASTLANLDFSKVGSATTETINTFAEITDFTKGQDTLSFAGLTKATVPVGTVATLEGNIAAVSAAAGATTGVFFEFSGSTYIYKDNGAAGLTDGDGLIKLTGATGLVLGTDLLAV